MRTLKTPEESGVVPLVTLAVMNKAFQNLGGTGLTQMGRILFDPQGIGDFITLRTKPFLA